MNDILEFNFFQVSLWPLRTVLKSRRGSNTTTTSPGGGESGGKYPEVDIALSTGLSYFLFFAGHEVVVFVRHSFDLAGAAGSVVATADASPATTAVVSVDGYYSKVIRVSFIF